MKKPKVYLITVIMFITFITVISHISYAQENNKVGISLLQPTAEDIKGASELTNSTNGDWGYATLVIQENDRDVRKWQDVFEQLRERHLIPLIRLATSPEGEVWRRPEEKDAAEWVSFFNKLNWVVKKRYIILFNEPNHASEWGGEVSPESYGRVAIAFGKAFKEANNNYVVMLAGMDGAAPSNPPQYEDSGVFIRALFTISGFSPTSSGQGAFQDYFDALASHSYPNPGFSGSVWDTGKKSIRGYEYELALLHDLGVQKNLPVFITETGWEQGKLSESTIADNYRIAYEQVWGRDERVRAVTPFVYKYLSAPFIGFSWIKENGYAPQYTMVKDLPKRKGAPDQIQNGSLEVQLPSSLIARSTYHFSVHIKNQGQAIWSQDEGYSLVITTNNTQTQTLVSDLSQLKPFEETRLGITIKTPSEPTPIELSLSLVKKGVTLLETKKHKITLEPFPELTIKTSIFPKFVSNADNFEVQFFNKEEELVFSKKGLAMRNGLIRIEDISDIIPGERYRIVLLGYPYIPRQTVNILSKGSNTVSLKRLLPFDADGNGRWDLNDIRVAFANPSFFLRFIPWSQL